MRKGEASYGTKVFSILFSSIVSFQGIHTSLKITGLKKNMWTLFQDEHLEFYCQVLPWIEEKIPSQHKGRNSRFSITSFHLNSCQMLLAHSNVWSRLHTFRVQCHYHCLACFFGTSRKNCQFLRDQILLERMRELTWIEYDASSFNLICFRL